VELAIFKAKRALDAGDALAALNPWGDILDAYSNGGGNINLRNFRLFGEYSFQGIMNDYLNQADVQAKYGARPGTHYVDVNLTMLGMFDPDWMRSARDAVLYDLQRIPCVFYTGQDTAFTPLPSQSFFLAGLTWSGQEQFNSLEYTNWNVTNNDVVTVYGNYKQFKNLHYFVVNKAGNYIPMDQMEASLDLLNKWIPKARTNDISQ
jgi:carboxypeptidase C (cathepsin A)